MRFLQRDKNPFEEFSYNHKLDTLLEWCANANSDDVGMRASNRMCAMDRSVAAKQCHHKYWVKLCGERAAVLVQNESFPAMKIAVLEFIGWKIQMASVKIKITHDDFVDGNAFALNIPPLDCAQIQH